MSDLHVVILAAGKGTRMRSALPKVLHRIGEKSLIERVTETAEELQPSTIVVVLGYEADAVQQSLHHRPGLRFARQEPQLGTGHALLQTEPCFERARGTLVLLSGDVPLLTSKTLRALVDHHNVSRAAATVLTARVELPDGYGRIVRNGSMIAAIVEDKDATQSERSIQEINSGIYAFDLEPLFDALRNVGADNCQKEYTFPIWSESIARGASSSRR